MSAKNTLKKVYETDDENLQLVVTLNPSVDRIMSAMEEYAKQKVAEAEETAFEAAREEEIVGECCEIDIKFNGGQYETVAL